MKNSIFYKQAELLLRILPLINSEPVFVLKGGTAINFFVRNLPRLSVDIDLTYLPLTTRQIALSEITRSLQNIAKKITRMLPKSAIVLKTVHQSDFLKGIIVNWQDAAVKIEPNLIIRGTVFPPETKPLSKTAQEFFEISMNVRTLSTAELYAGKICAAPDRQHPRDLFDIHFLLKYEGFSETIRKAFIVYLISHSRPMIELLQPGFKNIRDMFSNEFEAMTVEHVEYEELLAAREQLVTLILSSLTQEERQFLVSVNTGTPEWNLLGLDNIEKLPGVQWKLLNIRKMRKTKRQQAIMKLRDYLEV